MAKGIHLFPYRTQKLSLSAPMVLGWRRPGRVGHCRIPNKKDTYVGVFFICPVSFLLSRALSQVQHCTWLGCPRAASSGRREARGQRPGAVNAERFERLSLCWVFFLFHPLCHSPGLSVRYSIVLGKNRSIDEVKSKTSGIARGFHISIDQLIPAANPC